MKTVQLEIKRQASPDAPAVWEKFELEWRPGMNVISAMMEIAAEPGHRGWTAHHAHHLRLQLPRGNLRVVLHEDQRKSPHGLLRAGGESRAAHQG